MTKPEFEKGVWLLETAFQRKYSPDFISLLWRDFQELNGDIFVSACDSLKNQGGAKLPILGDLRVAYFTLEESVKRDREQEKLALPAPVRTDAEKAETAKLLRNTLEKLRAKAVSKPEVR